MDKIQQIASSFKVFSKIIEKRSTLLSNLQKPSPKNSAIFLPQSIPTTHKQSSFFLFLAFLVSILVLFLFRNNETVIWIRDTVAESWEQIQQKTHAETFIRGNAVKYTPDDIKDILSL
jgi:hypothetical protein